MRVRRLMPKSIGRLSVIPNVPCFQRGFLLVTSVTLIVIAALLIAVMVYFTATGSRSSARNLSSKQALFIAGTGLERGIRALDSPMLVERFSCDAVTGNANLTDIAFGAGRFTVTSANGGVSYYPSTATTLKAAIGATDSIIPVSSLSGYANAGRVLIDREAIDYSDVEPTNTAICGGAASTPCLLGAQRGRDGTMAVSHVSGTPVGQFQCDLQSQGGVPDLVNASGRRTVQESVQLQEGWAVGDRSGNNFVFVRWNQPTETRWNDASFANAANRNNLNAISVLSYADGWAVGNRNGNNFTIVQRTGAGWTPQPLAGNGGNIANLNGVHCIATSDCWAVGNRNGNNFTLLQRTFAGWSVQQLAGNGGNRANLRGVYCAATNDCWAVGDRNGNNFTFLRYNGAWSVQQLAGNGGNRANLRGVYCAATNDCWAVGDRNGGNFTLAYYNGTGWSIQQLNDPANRQNLNSVFCVSASDCWAVGNGGVIVRGSGSPLAWSVSVTPGGVTNVNLHAVTCVDSDDCWAAGDSPNPGVLPAVILHWDGNSWAAVTVPPTVTQNLRGIDVIGGRQRLRSAWREIYP